MIICNPNMGYAEVQQYNSEWPDFYLDQGINVVLWNYRGYGRSTGSPTPTKNREDSELVYHFANEMAHKAVRNARPIKIGVHGISVGGLAATYLGRTRLVDFMFIDRSFSNLQSFPMQFSKLFPPLLKFITLWDNPNCSRDYLYSNCYKVIAQDPNDEVIPDVCSLKTGVSLEIIS